jgi:hypothetical protein
MVLMNASKKVRSAQSIMNSDQGGGNKKAGFAYQVGKNSWSQIFISNVNPTGSGNCCTLDTINKMTGPFSNISRQTGRVIRG